MRSVFHRERPGLAVPVAFVSKKFSTPETVLVIPRALRLTVSGKDVQGKELPEFR